MPRMRQSVRHDGHRDDADRDVWSDDVLVRDAGSELQEMPADPAERSGALLSVQWKLGKQGVSTGGGEEAAEDCEGESGVPWNEVAQ